jgi:hypothetical protein
MTIATSFARAVSVTSLVLLLVSPASAQEQPVQSFPLNVYKSVLDGQWQGIRYASDGNVYFGSSTHSAHHGAAFFKFDPRTNQITMLAEDLTTICGEDPATNPQGKLHSDIVEANGWLYMSMHFSSELPGAYEHWTGSHVIGYQLATGAFHDFGVIHPNYTSYSAIGVDPARNYLYVFVTGEDAGDVSYLYRIDTVTGMKTNLGQVGGAWNASFWTFVDRRGDVWFSVGGQNGALRRVRGATGQIDVFPNALPPMYRWDSEQLVSTAEQAGRWIMWMQPLDGDRALFTLGWNGGMLYMFDASKPIGSGLEFQAIKHIGYSDLGLAIGGSRLFYYQRANRGFGQQEATDFHLLSVTLDPASGYPISDHGLLRDQDGRVAWRLPGMMTDGGHRLFMIGDWWTLPGDLGTLRYTYNNGVETYRQLPRGEFFAFADVDNDPAPGDPPVAPESFTATGISSTQINLSWSDVTGATGLSLERCSGAGCASFAQIASLNAGEHSFANSGLSAGVVYRYRLRAFSQGASVYSNIAEAATTAPLPPAPQSLIATTSATSEIALRWTDTSTVETGSVIERCAAPGCTSFVTVGQVAANTTTFVSGGLNSSTLYRFRVRAFNAGGSSPASNVAEATTLPTVPTALTAVAASSSQINVTWSSTPGATGTKVERCNGAGCMNFILIAQLTATTSPSTGLSAGTLYRFRVRSYNAGGHSAYSAIVEATTIPLSPAGLTAVPVSASELSLRWNDTIGETGFRVERCIGTGCTNFVEVGQTVANVITMSNTGLVSGALHRYRVKAFNTSGVSVPSSVVQATTLPTTPVGLAATAVSSGQINLTWPAIAGATGVRIERCAGTACTAFGQVTQLAAVTSYANTGLSPGTIYRYRVRGSNNGGVSAYSNVAETTSPPSAPGSLIVTPVSASELLLRWNDTGGETGFRIERCLGAACSAFAEVRQAAANTVTLTDSSLQSATLYRYRVRAFNTGGSSAPSNIAESTTMPATPANLSASAASRTQINLVWSTVTGAAGTRIERCAGATCTAFTVIAQVGAGVTAYANGGLSPSATYRYRVRAFNAGGQSAPSNIAQTMTNP